MAFFHSNFMLQTPHQDHDQNPPSTSLAHSILPSCSPHEFHGTFFHSFHFAYMHTVEFIMFFFSKKIFIFMAPEGRFLRFILCEDDPRFLHIGVASLLGTRPSTSFPTGIDGCDEMNMREDELSDDGSQLGEKKRRLNTEQVKTLEKSFEQGNKLEPERKLRLARALGLQPRQIAIWFQNRRARWKTKQLEKDFELLKRQFEALRKEKDSLQANNQKLHAEFEDLKILSLKTRESINLKKGTEGSCSNRTEDSSEIKLNISRNPAINSPSAMDHTTSKDGIAQFFQNSSRPEIQVPKMDQTHVKEESLCNMFCGMDDQTGFWPWLEQQHFN